MRASGAQNLSCLSLRHALLSKLPRDLAVLVSQAFSKTETEYESSAFLWWVRNSTPRVWRQHSEAVGASGLPSSSLALNEVLCSFWPQGLHSLSRVQGRPNQGLLS